MFAVEQVGKHAHIHKMARKAFLYVFLTCFICFHVQHTESFRSFVAKIPNGDKVPHPCKKNTIWTGVGHLNEFGGGKRNPFGYAFKRANFRWTKQLCQEDSDNDGKTNGEELGKFGVFSSAITDPGRPINDLRLHAVSC